MRFNPAFSMFYRIQSTILLCLLWCKIVLHKILFNIFFSTEFNNNTVDGWRHWLWQLESILGSAIIIHFTPGLSSVQLYCQYWSYWGEVRPHQTLSYLQPSSASGDLLQLHGADLWIVWYFISLTLNETSSYSNGTLSQPPSPFSSFLKVYYY